MDAVIPPGASIIVQLQDLSPESVIGTSISEATIPVTDVVDGRATFAIAYDPSTIVETSIYAVVGRVDTFDAQTIFVSIEPALVLTNGNPTQDVEVVLTAIGIPVASPPPVAYRRPADRPRCERGAGGLVPQARALPQDSDRSASDARRNRQLQLSPPVWRAARR